MIVKKLACAAAAALAAIAAAPASAATFIGDNVTIKRIQGGSTVAKTVSTTVGSGFEYTDNFFRIDVTDNQVIFRPAGGLFSIGDIFYEFSGLDFDGDLATANLIQDFAVTQIFSANQLIGSDRATISPEGLFRMSFKQTTGGASSLATVTFGAAPPVGEVPEPATWAMMIGGFGLVGGAMRSARRRRSTALVAA